MHLAQARIRLPANGLYFLSFVSAGTRSHWRLGYFLRLTVGLYFPLSFFRTPNILEPLPQIAHCLAICYNDKINFKENQ